MKLENKLVHIFNSHGIGDVIMTLPMIESVLNEGGRLLISVKGKAESDIIGAALGGGGSDNIEFIHLSRYPGFFGALSYIAQLQSKKIDISIPVTGIHPDKYNFMAFLSRAKYRVGCGGHLSFLNDNNFCTHRFFHKVEKNLEILSCVIPLSTDIELTCLSAYQTDSDFFGSRNLKPEGKVIALAPSSGEAESHKRWSLENFHELAKYLISRGNTVVILGSPGEEGLAGRILKNLNSEAVHNFVGALSIKESLDCLEQCDFLIANCNGLSHMGSLVPSLKIIGLYGPTNPMLTGPFRRDLVAVNTNLDCSPCYKRGYITGCGDPVCMRSIDVSLVIKEIIID
ncbi:glycosyltransferase family 9 protein [Vibrio sp. 404]|uniref:Glycosyltransferase family 9 protein n=1 Tax=Vibrio marinisediminis TaxID=2758441 RepID=A0A7W2FR80_9VIBR|nr:glycosyltransferase family 9 protein [Vibrio marinisediminis]MBA5762794.1 glycosyltransferase family 9 protein [Vibrio marinisediminis]